MQLASPPGRGRIRAAPSPTPPTHVHSNRHQSTSDEDNNAFDDKEEVYKNIFYNVFIQYHFINMIVFDLNFCFRYTIIKIKTRLFLLRIDVLLFCNI